MKPYFERDGVRIFHADCRELLPQLYADVVSVQGSLSNEDHARFGAWLEVRASELEVTA